MMKTVTWSVLYAVHPNTMIDLNGGLAVTQMKTATTLTVKAPSQCDSAVTSTATVTITDAPVIKYMLTVNNGSDSGEYAEGEEVTPSSTPGIGRVYGVERHRQPDLYRGQQRIPNARLYANQVLTITATYRKYNR